MNKTLSTVIIFDIFTVFKPASLVVVYDGKHDFYNKSATENLFLELSESFYIPILKMLENQEICTYALFTGRFLQALSKKPKLKTQIKKALKNKNVEPVLDSFYGDSYSSFYNIDWWTEGITSTYKLFNKLFGDVKKPRNIYLPQLFRGLALEKVITNTGIVNFIIPRNSKKFLEFNTNLADFRRFDGEKVTWINDENNFSCNFKFIPDEFFFYANYNIFQNNPAQAIKTFSLAVAYCAYEHEMKKSRKKLRTTRDIVRFNENPSISEFNELQKGAYRLWTYGSTLIHNRLRNYPHSIRSSAIRDYLSVTGKEYLFFLEKSLYLESDDNEYIFFSSSYEAMVNIQSTITKLEIYSSQNQL